MSASDEFDNQRLVFKNEFLNEYLTFVENTESPRIFHVMSVLVCAAACVGRRTYINWGTKQLYPNIYVALVGPPALRKSTAMDMCVDRLKAATGVRLAPDDTGGARQGFIKAIEGRQSEDMKEMMDEIQRNTEMTVEALGNMRYALNGDPRDIHCMLVAASEFNSVLGSNALDLLPLFNKVYDGENFTYKLKNDEMVLTDPLMSMIGCTTPTNIASAFPPETIGQGFMSRMILCFAAKRYKRLPKLPPLPLDQMQNIEQKFKRLFYEFEGELTISEEADKEIDNLYDKSPNIDDFRFTYYCQRRQIHIIKMSMLFCILRESHVISYDDVREATLLLESIEQYMPDALGEYGLSKLSTAKQKLIEYIRECKIPVEVRILWIMMGREMTLFDFKNTLQDLASSGKIKPVGTENGEAYMYVDQKEGRVQDIIGQLIAEGHMEDKSTVIPFPANSALGD